MFINSHFYNVRFTLAAVLCSLIFPNCSTPNSNSTRAVHDDIQFAAVQPPPATLSAQAHFLLDEKLELEEDRITDITAKSRQTETDFQIFLKKYRTDPKDFVAGSYSGFLAGRRILFTTDPSQRQKFIGEAISFLEGAYAQGKKSGTPGDYMLVLKNRARIYVNFPSQSGKPQIALTDATELMQLAQKEKISEPHLTRYRTLFAHALAVNGRKQEAREQLDLVLKSGFVDKYPNYIKPEFITNVKKILDL